MVDLALLQSASYIAGAIGVCVAAGYYIVNLSMSQRKAKIDTTNQLLQLIVSREGVREYLELLNMEWKDYECSKVSLSFFVSCRSCPMG